MPTKYKPFFFKFLCQIQCCKIIVSRNIPPTVIKGFYPTFEASMRFLQLLYEVDVFFMYFFSLRMGTYSDNTSLTNQHRKKIIFQICQAFATCTKQIIPCFGRK